MAIDEALFTTGLMTLLKAWTGKDYAPSDFIAPITPPPAPKNPIGINSTAAPSYYGRDLALADAYKGVNSQYQITLANLQGPDGKVHMPAGDYTVTFDGDGDFTSQAPGLPDHSDGRWWFDYISEPGKFVLPVTHPNGNGINLYVTRSNPADPVRNIRLWMPGYGETQPTFRDEYLVSLAGFGCVRFMDDMRTNGSPVTRWADRAQLADQQWDTAAGMPYEALIELANKAKADAWFCIPVRADDDFVAQFATLVEAQLDPSLKVYVELSNELWNWAFEQSRFETTQDCPDKEIFYGHTSWVQYRSQQIFRIFEGVLGADRLFRVIGAQFDWGNADHADFCLAQATKYAGGAVAFDGLAVAPYLDQPPVPVDDKGEVTISVEDYLAQIKASLADKTIPMMKANAAVAAKHGTSLIAYEAGLGLQSGSPQTKAFVERVNQDPGMFDLYTAYLDTWFACGGRQINFFNLTGDVWGQQAWADSPIEESQKLRALRSYKAKA